MANPVLSPVLVHDGIEGQPIPPAGGEVVHVDIGVPSRLHLAPQQQGILGRLLLLVVLCFHTDVLDLRGKEARFYSWDGGPLTYRRCSGVHTRKLLFGLL